ncbi:MAG TPA: 3D domain-containing protein [Gemmatimonadaceae bacterium]|nr:3D domain-containing protein [Gemmatimonadaceae bacterium]
MKRGELIRLVLAVAIAIAFIKTGVTRLPAENVVLKHRPVLVYARPAMVAGARKIISEGRSIENVIRRASAREALRMRALGITPDPKRFARATPGEEIPISLTQYCLKGTTRRGRWVRPGIVAADPRIFPLARYVEVFMGKKYLGRFLVDDTGGNVIGATLDIWTPSCSQASRFGRQQGRAVLVAKEEEHIPNLAQLQLDLVPDLRAVADMFEGIAKK